MKFLTLVLLALMASPVAAAESQGTHRPRRRLIARYAQTYSRPPADDSVPPSAQQSMHQQHITPALRTPSEPYEQPTRQVVPQMLPWAQRYLGFGR